MKKSLSKIIKNHNLKFINYLYKNVHIISLLVSVLILFALIFSKNSKFIFYLAVFIISFISYIITKLSFSAKEKYKSLTKEYEVILNNTSDVIVLFNVKNNLFIYHKVNKAYEKSINLSKENILGKNIFEIHDKAYANFLENKLKKVLKIKKSFTFDDKIDKKEQIEYWQTKLSPVFDKKEVKQIVAISRNITEKKKSNKKIAELSFKDSLTGVFNRNYFQKEINNYDKTNIIPISIIIGDINGLKLANDAFGHKVGDELLKNAANKLKQSCREQDTIARWGGDEFVILLPFTDYDGVKKVCNRIKREMAELEADPIRASIALGCSTKTKSNESLNDIFRTAENVMYKRKLKESKNARSKIISSIKDSYYKKTCESKKHCDNLKKLSVKLAKEIDLDQNLINDLKLLADMHDIGKVGINENIIKKSSSLNHDEWNKMKRHSEIGYQIANSTPELSSIADAILSHHEHWDGSGYPLGQSGTEIPLLARIIAITDAYDVMTSKRPYKKAISKKSAIAELKKEAGKQFDPNLVKTFINRVLINERKGSKYDTA
ncbi:MAG: HD domain-containing phosphohydrolase [Bacillota bacterium]